ncbi:hypothetical protein ACVU7I_09430, partial [Patulibacter sp. S7RM1-6]
MILWRAWDRLGAVPALPFVIAFLALAGLAQALAEGAVLDVALLVLLAGLAAYCLARPTGGGDVFLAVAAPNVVAQVAHAVVGAPRWLYVVLLPIALIGAWSVDRETRAARADRSATELPEPAGSPAAGGRRG